MLKNKKRIALWMAGCLLIGQGAVGTVTAKAEKPQQDGVVYERQNGDSENFSETESDTFMDSDSPALRYVSELEYEKALLQIQYAEAEKILEDMRYSNLSKKDLAIAVEAAKAAANSTNPVLEEIRGASDKIEQGKFALKKIALKSLDQLPMKESVRSGSGGLPQLAFDDDVNTLWISEDNQETNQDHWMKFSLGGSVKIAAITYQPPLNDLNGRFASGSIRIDNTENPLADVGDGEWNSVSEFAFSNSGVLKVVEFPAVDANKVKIEVSDTYGEPRNQIAAAAEINVMVLVPADKTELEAKIQEIEELQAEAYKEGWDNLTEKKAAALEMLDANFYMTGTEVKEQTQVLQEAVEELVLKSGNADLSGLSYVVGGKETAVPEFTADRTSYTITLPEGTTGEISFEAIAADGAARVESPAVVIADKAATGTITVIAESGATKEYTLNFMVAKSSNAKVKSLTYTVGNVKRSILEFTRDNDNYNISLPEKTTGIITMLPVAADTEAKCKTSPVELKDGSAVATVTCTAEDGTEKIYTFNFKENKIVKDYTITVLNGEPEERKTLHYNYQDVAEVTALKVDGKDFDYWTVDGAIVSYNDVYRFSAVNTITIKANYRPKGEAPVQKPSVVADVEGAKVQTGDKFTIYFSGQIVMPKEGYEVVKFGMVYINQMVDESNEKDFIIGGKINGVNVVQKISPTLQNSAGQYRYVISGVNADQVRAGRMYLIYKNTKTGVEETVYSPNYVNIQT